MILKNDAAKKTVSDKLVAKVNNIDTSDFVLKTKYSTDKTELEIKIPNTSGLVKKIIIILEIIILENKIPDIRNLATKSALTTVENKITDVGSLVKIQTIAQKLLKLKINLIIIIMRNILQLQSLILYLLMFLMRD